MVIMTMVMMATAAAHVTRTDNRDAWDPALTLREGRSEYFRFNNFGDDGGYNAKWVDFKLGPIPFPFPNTPSRVEAVKYHDLHHVMTGYQTNFIGELEISAWEIGSGCADKYAAWVLNLGGFAGGMLMAPRRTFAALVRGRRSKNLYRYTFDDKLLDRSIGDMRAELGVDSHAKPEIADYFAAAWWFFIGFFVGWLTLWLMLPLVPIGYVAGKLFRK
jgi:hypothetical protein